MHISMTDFYSKKRTIMNDAPLDVTVHNMHKQLFFIFNPDFNMKFIFFFTFLMTKKIFCLLL